MSEYDKLSTTIEDLISNSKYEEATSLLMKSFNFTIGISFLKYGLHFKDDKEPRDIYQVTISKNKRSFTFNFGNSINDSGFYVQYGKRKIILDKKYIGSPGLSMHIRQSIPDYLPNKDKIHYPIPPTNYSIISCLQKYDIGDFNNFCSEFGYDTNSILASKIYTDVLAEYQNMCILFSDEELNVLNLIN